jgi:hypothetical protein
LDEDDNSSIVMTDYLLRGALLCPVTDQEGEKAHYVVDTIDPDMFFQENY